MKTGPIRFSFQTKVLAPVLAVMVGLVALTLYTINRRITRSVEQDMARKLATADGVFRNSHSIRGKNLMLRYRTLSNEPRFRAVVQLPDSKTVRFMIHELVAELGAEAMIFIPADGGEPLFVSRDAVLKESELLRAAEPVIESSLQGQPSVDLVLVENRLFDMVAVPVVSGDRVTGSLVVPAPVTEVEARELAQLTDCDIALLADGRCVVSTASSPGLRAHLESLYRTLAGHQSAKMEWGGNHYLTYAGRLHSQRGEVGYLLLSSYESALSDLAAMQRTLLFAGGVGIALASLAVWFLVRNITRPLRLLRDSAEAVGRGDYSRRVAVNSRDECGDLAQVFNQMTANVQTSRCELEKTVDTLKKTQEQLVQREKLSAIGEFVAGVTHELNNPLTSVLGYAELLRQSNLDEPQQRDAQAIVTGAQRCQKIVQNLLSFARQHKPERKRAQLNDLILNVLEFMQYDLRTSNITIVKRLDPKLPSTLMDTHQIQQVFVNLVHNARQALESFRADGAIIISTESSDGWVRATFQDNGPGIAEENLSRVFDPFFTTKPVGKGTGLGLSLSYGIIKEHGGNISVSSQPGMGATFLVELPVSFEPGPIESDRGRDAWGDQREGVGRKVLVVDDESGILNLTCAALDRAGYEVEGVRDGEEALRRMAANRYDVVVCDMKMPGIGGRAVFERSRTLNQGAFVFMTGDVMNARHQEFIQAHGLVCLTKPFSLDEFRSVIHRSATTP